MSESFRIGVFSYGLPAEGLKRGGIERVAHDLAEGLARRGHRVTVWSHDPKPRNASYDVVPLPWKSFTASWLGRRVTMGYLGNALALLPRYGDSEVILAHGDSLLLPLRGKPVVRIMHGSAQWEAKTATNPLRALMQTGVYVQELATALTQRNCVGVSEHTRTSNPFVRRFIHNGVDLDIFRADPDERSSDPSILFVGTLGGRKRGDFLLRCFRREVLPEFPGAKLMMVAGGGSEERGVEYHSAPDDRTLASLYRRAWIYASPSSYEGFGLPYVEALASGTPVVASPNPGSREILAEGDYGMLVSDSGFGPAIVRLLGDEQLRRELGERGVRRAKEFALQKTIDEYETLIASVVKGRR